MATRNDVVNVMQMLNLEYPDLLGGLDKFQAKQKIDLWYDVLNVCDAAVLANAAKTVVAECRTTPKLAHLVQQIRFMTSPAEKTSEELWETLSSVANFMDSEITGLMRQAEATERVEVEKLHEEDRLEDYSRAWQAVHDRVWDAFYAQSGAVRKRAFESLPDILKAYVATPDKMSELGGLDEAEYARQRSIFFKQIPEVREIVKRNEQRRGYADGQC